MEKSYFKKNIFGLFNMKIPLLWSLFFFITLQATSQQSRIITGTVTSSKNVPLVGVGIFVKGSTTGVSSDFDGKYKIKIPRGGKQLIVTYIGFKTQKIPIKGQSTINVIMVEDVQKLDEVTINTGYQKISKERVTGSVEKINSKVLGIKTAQDILSKIAGEIPGFLGRQTYSKKGRKEGFGYRIRGIGSIAVGSTPLVVVDGFPVTQDLSSINPNDVASISILKDAAAASIWGIRAANGVIVITTKKGKRNHKPTIEYSSNFSITQRDNLYDFQDASTASLLEFKKEKVDNSWPVGFVKFNRFPLGKGLKTYINLKAGLITQSKADAIINRLKQIDIRDELQKLFMNNVYWTQHHLAISGGGKYNTYRGSVTYDKNENLRSFKGNELNKITLNFGGTFNLSPKLKLTNNFNFITESEKKNGFFQSALEYKSLSIPLFQDEKILDDQGNYIDQTLRYSQEFKKERLQEVDRNPYSWSYNSKQEFDNKNHTSESTLFKIQTKLEYKLLSYLSVEGSYQYEWKSFDEAQLSNENTYYTREMVNTYTTLEDKKYINYVPKGSILEKTRKVAKAHQGRFQLNFDKSFNEGIHRITALGGYEVRQELSNDFYHTFYGYDPQTLTFGNVIYRQGRKTGGGPDVPGRNTWLSPNDYDYINEDEDRYISYYGNFAYTYNHKYTLTGSIRLDDTNLFGASEKYKNIPLFSLGGKWDIGKEYFLENNSVIDYLNFRLTYGANGNVDRSTSPQLTLAPYISRISSTRVNTLRITHVKNSELRLERVFTTNIGIDFGLFNRFLEGSIEYYKKNSIDLLSNTTVYPVLGFDKALANVGKMENEGFDIKLRAHILRKNALKYNTIVNFSYNRNRVTEVDFPKKTVDQYVNFRPPLKNHPLYYIYSYRSAGLDSKGNPQLLNKKGQLIDINMQTKVNGVPTNVNLTTEDLVYNGTTTPKYYGSWINNISYKSLYLRTLFTFKFGHIFRNRNVINYSNYILNTANNIHKDFDRRWKKSGDENKTNIPKVPTKDELNSVVYGRNPRLWLHRDEFVDSAAHIRLKEITIGYNLKSELLKKTGIDALNISFQIQNLGIINFNKWNVDPDSRYLPIKPTYTLHFSVNF